MASRGLRAGTQAEQLLRIGLAEKVGEKDAEQVLRDANRRHPDSVVVMNNLAQTLSDQGQNSEALKLIDQARAQPSPFTESLRETRELIVQRLR